MSPHSNKQSTMDVLVYSKDPELIRLVEDLICRGHNCAFFQSAGTPEEYRKMAALIIFDLIILDGEIPCSGTSLDPKELADRSRTEILYVGDADDVSLVVKMFREKRCSFIFRENVLRVIRKAIRYIATGKRYADPAPAKHRQRLSGVAVTA